MNKKDIEAFIESANTWEHNLPQQEHIKSNPYFANHKMEVVNIDDLIKDNDLDNSIALSNHEEKWGNDPKKYSYRGYLNTAANNIIYGTRQADGRIRLGDGRHRTRALKNAGYNKIRIPILDESKNK